MSACFLSSLHINVTTCLLVRPFINYSRSVQYFTLASCIMLIANMSACFLSSSHINIGLLGYIWADYIYVLDAVAYFVDSDSGVRHFRSPVTVDRVDHECS